MKSHELIANDEVLQEYLKAQGPFDTFLELEVYRIMLIKRHPRGMFVVNKRLRVNRKGLKDREV